MTGLRALVARNCKLFFKDKGMFVTSLITPMILLVLYVTFLSNVYKEAFTSVMSMGFSVPEALINGTVGGQLISSMLAVSCVTVAFCSNLLMVQDKVSGAVKDLRMTPVKGSTMALGYFISSALCTLLICLTALVVCLGYLHFMGWYLTVADVGLLVLDVILLVIFGTALSSVVNFSLSTSGQASAVGTIVSAGYGFVCGAYMPISNFSGGLQKILSFLPGTYGTSLLRNHALRGVYTEMNAQGFPAEVVEGIKDSIDCNLYFFGDKVELETMYVILGGAILVLIGIFIVMNVFQKTKK
ncbi:MAG: ABC transporter permease [Oscillospiraceae bacterium]|jgi:multidrug/hemolysin transport system permease protein